MQRCVKVRVSHAPGMSGTFSPPPTSKETAGYRSRLASRHVRHARALMHVMIANPRWRGIRSQHTRRMRNPHFNVSGKRPMEASLWNTTRALQVIYFSISDYTCHCHNGIKMSCSSLCHWKHRESISLEIYVSISCCFHDHTYIFAHAAAICRAMC